MLPQGHCLNLLMFWFWGCASENDLVVTAECQCTQMWLRERLEIECVLLMVFILCCSEQEPQIIAIPRTQTLLITFAFGLRIGMASTSISYHWFFLMTRLVISPNLSPYIENCLASIVTVYCKTEDIALMSFILGLQVCSYPSRLKHWLNLERHNMSGAIRSQFRSAPTLFCKTTMTTTMLLFLGEHLQVMTM